MPSISLFGQSGQGMGIISSFPDCPNDVGTIYWLLHALVILLQCLADSINYITNGKYIHEIQQKTNLIRIMNTTFWRETAE